MIDILGGGTGQVTEEAATFLDSSIRCYLVLLLMLLLLRGIEENLLLLMPEYLLLVASCAAKDGRLVE